MMQKKQRRLTTNQVVTIFQRTRSSTIAFSQATLSKMKKFRWGRIAQHIPMALVIIGASILGWVFIAQVEPTDRSALIPNGLILIVVLGIVVAIIGGYSYNWRWTGFSQHDYPKKTLWDWMGLLIVPVVLAIGGFWFSQAQSTNEQGRAEERAQLEHNIAQDNQRETTLQTYLDQMAELLIEQRLRSSEPDSEIREVARVRTLTALRRLDSNRQTILFQFLHDTELIGLEPDSIIDFQHADLSRINFSKTRFPKVNLSQASLAGADLTGATLRSVHLYSVNLVGANLTDADLSGTNLQGANLTDAVLIEANLADTDLTGAVLIRTKLPKADLYRANLQGNIFTQPDLSGASLIRANLSGATLIEADLSEAVFLGADLTGIALWMADLSKASFYEVDFTDADLSGANLQGANLTDAVLIEANLADTDLTDAIVTEEQLASCKSLNGATLPDGTKVPDNVDNPFK